MKEWFENKTVAIVGNAMSLFDSKYGNDIDNHDVVVRLNKAAMLINKFDVEISHGKKTAVWMFWNVIEYYKHFEDIDQKIKKMHMGHQSRDHNKLSQVDYIYPDNLYEKLKLVAGERKNPTTGFMSIDYVISCNPFKLNIYGFDWKETPTHTDPNRKKEKLCPHNYDAEKEHCLNFWMKDERITFFHNTEI